MKRLITFSMFLICALSVQAQLIAPFGIKIGNYKKTGTSVITIDSVVQLSTNQFQLYKGATLLNAANVLKLNISDSAAMLSKYARLLNPIFTGTIIKLGTDTLSTKAYSRSTGGVGKLAISDTSGMLSRYSRIASPTFTGVVTIPTPFYLGVTSVTVTGTQLNTVDATSSIQTQLNTKADTAGSIDIGTVAVKLLPDTVQYTDAFTLALTDAHKLITGIKATSMAITIPLNSSVAIPVGTTINFIQAGAGILVFKKTAGVVLTSFKDSVATDGIWSWASLWKRGTNNWCLYGNIGQ